jgi:hypothetical protein
MAGAAIAAESPASSDRTWDMKLADQPSGSFMESTRVDTEGNVTTKERMAMDINRLGNRVSISNETETLENRGGEMQSLVATMSSSQAATRLRVTRSEEALQIVTEAGGKSYEKKIPFTGTIVGPKGLEKLGRENLKKEGATITYRMFSPELGNVATMERKVVGIIDDKGRKLLRCEETVEGFPGKQFVTIDENGRWITRQQTFPFGELVIEASTRATAAQAPAPAPSTTLPTESYDRTMARSNILLPDPRSISGLRNSGSGTSSLSLAGLSWKALVNASWKNRAPWPCSKCAGATRRPENPMITRMKVVFVLMPLFRATMRRSFGLRGK